MIYAAGGFGHRHAFRTPGTAQGGDFLHPLAPFRAEAMFEIAADAAGEAGGGAIGGDREEQIAAADFCDRMKVAKFGLVLDIHQDPQGARLGGESRGCLRRETGDPEDVEIGEFSGAGERAEQNSGFGSEVSGGGVGKQQGMSRTGFAEGAQTAQRDAAVAGDRQIGCAGVECDGDHADIRGDFSKKINFSTKNKIFY
jgi:hypothetical protein